MDYQVFYPNSPSCFLSLVLLLISTLSFFIFKKFKTPTNLPPSPPGLPIIGNLHQIGKLPHRSLWELSKRFGALMHLRLGQVPVVVISSPTMAKEVLKMHDHDCCSRPISRGTKRLSYNLRDFALAPYSDYWKEMRKLCVTHLFAAKKVQSFSHVREEEVSCLIETLSQVSPNLVKLDEKIFSLMNNITCKIAFGRTFNGRQFQWGSGSIQEIMNEALALMGCFWCSDFFAHIGFVVDAFRGLHWRLENCFRDFDQFLNRVLEERLADPNRTQSKHEDILGILLELSQDETQPFRFSKDHVKAVLFDIIVGAIDTASITVTWAMTELTKNPRVMQKIQTEIRTSVEKNPTVQEAQLENLRYLKMVVKETLRLHPPLPLLVPRESMRHFRVGSFDIYPKTRIYVNVWGIGRDPDEFNPERFEDSDIDYKGQDFELLPGGAGRRICPGLIMGVTSVELTLANLLHCFDWELPGGVKREEISMEEEAGLTVHKKLPLFLVPMKHKWG